MPIGETRPTSTNRHLGVLGGLRVLAGTITPIELLTNSGLVLAALIARGNERVSVDELAAVVWPMDRPVSFRKGIQVSINKLRDLLDHDRAGRAAGESVIRHHQDAYELQWPLGRIDSGRFELLVRSGQRALADGRALVAAGQLSEAMELWAEPFGGADVPALRDYVERLRATHRAAATALIEADVQLGREDLVQLEQAVAEDPFDERRWGYLMIALFRRGRQVEALETFQRARKLLIDEMGLEPGPYLRRIEEQILLQEGPSLEVVAASAHRSVATSWPGPPRLGHEVLHRDDEVRSVETQLQRWHVVTIVGPPGVGKTTLASAVAARHPGRVAWISLGTIASGAGAIIEIARRAGVESEVGSESDEFTALLASLIGDHPLLLVLDNAEHLVDSVGPLVEELVRSCPNLVVLLTSRRMLGTGAEHVVPLDPFRTTDDEPAIAYLAERAGIDRLDSADIDALRRIAVHVGGLALGLEQAAARLRSLSPAELADRLDLVEEPERTDGLSRAIDWSLSLLRPDALDLLTALAHLEGPWELERAEAIGQTLGLDPPVVRRALQDLVGHSLISVYAAGDPHRHIIEPVRQHLRRAASIDGSTHRCQSVCAEVVLAEVTVAARQLEGGGQRVGIDRLAALMPDVQRVVAWAVANERPAVAAALLGQLRSWWWASGRYADGQLLHAAADSMIEAWRPNSDEEIGLRLRALTAGVGTRPGFAGPALRASDLRVLIAEAQDHGVAPEERAWMTQMLSAGLTFTNDAMEDSIALARRALEDARSSGDQWSTGWALYSLGIAVGRTDPVQGLAFLEESVVTFEAAGDRLNAARVLMFLGHGIRIFGDGRNADDAFARAEEWCRELGAAPVTQLDCALGRAQSADTAGDIETAAALYRTLVPRLWQLGDYRCAAVAQRNLGAILLRQGDIEGANALALRSLQLLRRLEGEDAELASAQLLRAEIAVARRQFEFAARLWGRAEVLSEGGGVPMDLRDFERLATLRDTLAGELGEPRVESLAAEGRTDDVL